MSVSNDFLSYVIEQISAVGSLRTKRMFGAVGLYSGDYFFAIIDDDTIYLKTDESNYEAFKARGMRQFMASPDQPASGMGYYEVPADVLEDRDEMVVWARKSVAVSAASAARKHAKKARVSSPAPAPRRRRSKATRSRR